MPNVLIPELRHALEQRERAIRHALRYRRLAYHARDVWMAEALAAIGREERLRAAIAQALDEGCNDWRRALEDTRR
jgi:hypothetical protein